MLENYYFRPATVDRIRTSWIAPAIEQYVNWLTERHAAPHLLQCSRITKAQRGNNSRLCPRMAVLL
jgi:hypothetical protein